MSRTLAAAAAMATCLALPAPAAEWAVVPEQSTIAFDYLRAGTPDAGRFTEFSGGGTMDPAEPGAARLSIAIESASIDLGDPVWSGFATSAEWFDSATWPEVVYTLLRLDVQPDGSFLALGDVTIRGETETLTAPVTLVFEDGIARARGTVTVNRRDFLLGVGPSELFTDIGPEVSVRFDLHARRLD